MNQRLLLVGLLLATVLPVRAVHCERPSSALPQESVRQQLQADIAFLASEELRGRSVADETIDEAADYIADRMTKIGLDTTTVDGGPFQPLNVTLGARPGSADNNGVTITSDTGQWEPSIASLSQDMNPLAIGSISGDASGRLAFVGYGITAPKLNYDDYQGIDVSGAIVIILRKEPQASDPRSKFSGTRNTRHAFFSTKIDNAIQHGASAVVILNDPASVSKGVEDVRRKITREEERKERIEQQIAALPAEAENSRKTLAEKLPRIDAITESLQQELQLARRGVLGVSEAGDRVAGKDSIPVVSLSRDLVSTVLRRSSGQSLEALERKIDESSSPESLYLPDISAKLRVELKPTTARTSNVIGVLAGRGELAEESVVVGAHYDHVGMGGYGSLAPGTIAVHNGADDNASGTAALLATASQLSQWLPGSPSHRRIVFIAFTGEERGLVGSKYYVRSRLFSDQETVAMVNMDMVGRLRDNELTVYGTGSGDFLDRVVEEANQRHQFRLFKVSSGYGPSDHQSFYQAGVPVLFFFTGLHNDYHRPSDDFDKIEFGGMTRVTDIVSEVTYELATRQERPKYAETENRVQIRRQLTAYLGVTLSDRGDHVVISGLTDGGPAQRGGLRVGDRLEKLGESRVSSASDVLEQMRKRSPGDRMTVRLTRGRQILEITVQLTSRPGG